MDDLLIKYLLGETTPEENTRVGEWLLASETNRRRLEQFRAIWTISGGRQGVHDMPDKHKAWQRTRQKMLVETPHGTEIGNGVRAKTNNGVWKGEATLSRPDRYRVWKAAAILTGIIGLGVMAYVLTRPPSPAVTVASRTDTIRGSRETTLVVKTEAIKDDIRDPESRKKDDSWRKVVAGDAIRVDSLPDGSVVQLSRGSAIIYPESFRGHRTIHLEGDATFDVTHDALHPFVVQTQDITIQVLGTSFDVFSQAGRTSVIMRTGITRVIRGKDSLVLHACEGIVAVKGEKGFRDTIPTAVDSQNIHPRKETPDVREAEKVRKQAEGDTRAMIKEARVNAERDTRAMIKEVRKEAEHDKTWIKEARKSPCAVDERKTIRSPKMEKMPVKPKIAGKPKKLPPYYDPSIEESKQTIRSIIGELIAAGIVSHPDSVRSFYLGEKGFVVNDQPMTESLTSRFRSSYIRSGDPDYYYGPAKVYGIGVHFDKKEIFPKE